MEQIAPCVNTKDRVKYLLLMLFFLVHIMNISLLSLFFIKLDNDKKKFTFKMVGIMMVFLCCSFWDKTLCINQLVRNWNLTIFSLSALMGEKDKFWKIWLFPFVKYMNKTKLQFLFYKYIKQQHLLWFTSNLYQIKYKF